MKEFEWFEWFEWFGPSPIELFNLGSLTCEGRAGRVGRVDVLRGRAPQREEPDHEDHAAYRCRGEGAGAGGESALRGECSGLRTRMNNNE